jgi:hypothetical protein
MKTSTLQVSLSDLSDSYPSGVYSERYGCFYFLDYDGELGYFIQYENGMFETEVQCVDLDTMSEDEADEIRMIEDSIHLRI